MPKKQRKNEEYRTKRAAEGAIARIEHNKALPKSRLASRVKQTRKVPLPVIKRRINYSDYYICTDFASEDIRG